MSPSDYASVRNQFVHFNTGDSIIFHTLHLNQDKICEDEPNEYFLSTLSLASGVHPIIISRPNAQVVIDDSTETCGRISGKNSLLYTRNSSLKY